MRIAVVSAYLFDDSIGGAENHIRFLCADLIRRGHHIVVFKPVVGECRESGSVIDGIEVRYVAKQVRFDPRKLADSGVAGRIAAVVRKLSFALLTSRLIQAIGQFDPDVVWQHDFLSSWLACKRLAGRYRVVLTNHQGQYLMLMRWRLGRVALRWLLGHYAAIIGPSRDLTPNWREECSAIANGVDTPLFRPLADEARGQLRRELYGAEPETVVVFCPRRWAPTKGVDVFVDAVDALVGRRNDLKRRATIVFAGNDYREYEGYRNRITAKLERVDCRKVLLGDLDVYDMVRHYQCADIVVIPSRMEAVSLAALEAMACGCVVVSSAVGGMRELIVSGENGFLVPPGESSRLSEVLEMLIGDRSLREMTGARGRSRVSAEFSWSHIGERTEAVLLRASRCEPGRTRAGSASSGA